MAFSFVKYLSKRSYSSSVVAENIKPVLNNVKVLDLTRIVAGPYCTMILGDMGADVYKIENPNGDDESRNVRTIAPHIIYCSLSGYGPKGIYKSRPGYDVIAASIGGFMNITGPKEGEPCKAGVAMTDIATGLYAHGAILAALYQRTQTGVGQKIDCNLLSTQLACLINIGSNYLNANLEGERWGSSHPSIVPYKSYRTSDKKYLTIGTGSDKQFFDLCHRLNISNLITDKRFSSNQDRVKNREDLDTILSETFALKTLSDWEIVLNSSSFPFGPVNTLQDTFNNEHVKSINIVQNLEHPIAGTIKVVGPPVDFSSFSNGNLSPPPTLGQHTNEGVASVKLTLTKPKKDKKVNWRDGTVDNEHMNKKKSKCCCIYKKPRRSLDSSSEDEGTDCDDCRGHVEKKKKHVEVSPEPSSATPMTLS